MATLLENTQRVIAVLDRMVENIKAKGVTILAGLTAEQQADKILEISGGSSDWKDPLWWDIYNIIANDDTPGYIAKFIYLLDDSWMTMDLQGADAYRLSDGTFYEAPSTTVKISHKWLEHAYKPDSSGGKTKYLIRYWKSSNASTGGSVGTGTNAVGAWPIYMVAKDSTISTSSFPSSSYILKGYDHINCQYSGSGVTTFFSNSNHLSLVYVPDTGWNFTSDITTIGSAFSSPLLKVIDYTMFGTSQLTATGQPSPGSSASSIEKLLGVINMQGRTTVYTLRGNNIREARFSNIDCSFTATESSVLSKETLESIKDALSDRTGQTSLTLSVGHNGRTFPKEWWDEIRAKNWTVGGVFT